MDCNLLANGLNRAKNKQRKENRLSQIYVKSNQKNKFNYVQARYLTCCVLSFGFYQISFRRKMG